MQAPAHKSHAGAVVAVVLLLLLVLAVFIVPLPFSFSISNPGSASTQECHAQSFTSGAAVSFQWSTGGGSTVTFSVEDSSGNAIYTHNGASGSGSFTSNGASYDFCIYNWIANSVSVSGSAPLL